MKKAIIIYISAVLLIFLIPFTVSKFAEKPRTRQTSAENQQDVTKINVFDFDEQKYMELDLEDYVLGSLCAEMPASFEDEALKAQAVAIRTYAYNKLLLFFFHTVIYNIHGRLQHFFKNKVGKRKIQFIGFYLRHI